MFIVSDYCYVYFNFLYVRLYVCVCQTNILTVCMKLYIHKKEGIPFNISGLPDYVLVVVD